MRFAGFVRRRNVGQALAQRARIVLAAITQALARVGFR
jgi:hypothetical protein